MRTFKIQNTDVKISTDWQITKSISSRSTFSGTVVIYPSGFIPKVDTEIEVKNNETIIFRGVIDSVTPKQNGNLIEYNITATDFSVFADYHLTSNTAYGKTAGWIIKNILLPVLAVDGITAGTIEDGETITKAVFTLQSIADCLDDIVDVCGEKYYWLIDENKKLHFRSRTNLTANINISSLNKLSNFSQNKDIQDYRNMQIVIGAQAATATQQETVYADENGEIKLRFPLAKQPYMAAPNYQQSTGVGIVITDIGVSGLDNNAEFQWSYGSNIIKQKSDINYGQIVVIYTGLYTPVSRRQNRAEINRKAELLPGTSGIREKVYSDNSINESGQANQYSAALLQKYSKDAESITYEYEAPTINFNAGELVHVEYALYGIDSDYLCSGISFTCANSENLKISVTLSGGNAIEGWIDFFRRLVKKTNNIMIGESDIATIIKDSEELADLTGIYNIKTYDCLFPSNTLYPANTLYPSKLNNTEVKND